MLVWSTFEECPRADVAFFCAITTSATQKKIPINLKKLEGHGILAFGGLVARRFRRLRGGKEEERRGRNTPRTENRCFESAASGQPIGPTDGDTVGTKERSNG